MLDATKGRLPVIDNGYRPGLVVSQPDKINLATSLKSVRQRGRLMIVLTLVGAVIGCLLGLTFIAVRIPAYSASSELMISNTTLNLSGPEAVVTQVMLDNSVIESAMALLKSTRVLERVVDNLGLDEVERISVKKYAWPSSRPAPETNDSRRQAAISSLKSNTTVTRVGASQIVAVRTRAISAIDAARLSNEIAGALVKDQYDANAIVTTNAALRERIKVLGPTVRIISEAAPPISKDAPSGTVALLLAIIAGTALGAASALAWILLDPRLRSAAQLVAATSVECFGYVPLTNRPDRPNQPSLPPKQSPPKLEIVNRSRRGPQPKQPAAAKKAHPVTTARNWLTGRIRSLAPWPLGAEPKDAPDLASSLKRSILRRVRLAVSEKSTSLPHIIGVTSLLAGEGKTTLAADLALFVANEGTPVLLIDASSPESTQVPGQKREPGLHELLRGTSTADKVVQRDICPHLDFLPRGALQGDVDMWWGDLLHAVASARTTHYKWIIIDLPGFATDIDVRAAGQVLDDLLIVVEWGRTTRTQFKQGLSALGPLQERIIGTVLNKVPWSSIDTITANSARNARSSNHRSEIIHGQATR
ncbi:cellulose synthase operon protein YhjQ/BcsQ [Bradyrhizobium sp.]|uniref:polysaccharide biosynthesis tyrosine autokinase n=1 Tax=Bradyrhizobium sp. TaxID=376 RepID=UPI0039E64BE9